jgi:hypothetical protein
MTPLMVSCHIGVEDAVTALVALGADINVVSKHAISDRFAGRLMPYHATALWFAVNNLVMIKGWFDEQTGEGPSGDSDDPLVIAQTNIVRMLINRGALLEPKTEQEEGMLRSIADGY